MPLSLYTIYISSIYIITYIYNTNGNEVQAGAVLAPSLRGVGLPDSRRVGSGISSVCNIVLECVCVDVCVCAFVCQCCHPVVGVYVCMHASKLLSKVVLVAVVAGGRSGSSASSSNCLFACHCCFGWRQRKKERWMEGKRGERKSGIEAAAAAAASKQQLLASSLPACQLTTTGPQQLLK